MDEVSPLIVLPLKVRSLINGESVFVTRDDVASVELIARTQNLFSEPSMTKLPVPRDNRSLSSSSVLEKGAVIEVDCSSEVLNITEDGSKNSLVFNTGVSKESRGGDKQMVCHGKALASNVDSKRVGDGDLEHVSDHCKRSSVLIVKKSLSEVEESSGSAEELGEAVNVIEPKRTFSTSILEVSEEVKLNKHIFPHNFPPLWGSTSICGRRREMEDSVVTLPRFLKIPPQMLRENWHLSLADKDVTAHLFGVYDGHGGCQVARYCQERLHLTLAEEISTISERLSAVFDEHDLQACWLRVFSKCFRRLDNEVGGFPQIDGDIGCNPTPPPVAPESVGSTAVVAVICSTHIIVANVGDSRAVLYRGKVSMPLSVDHKPNREDEYERIEAAGGKVIKWDGYRVSGVLAVSRSIGDRYLRPYVIADPELMFIPRVKEDECLILASDGLWDVMTNDEACDLARRRILLWHKKYSITLPKIRGEESDPAAQDAADYLSRVALQRGSRDNISIIVVDLKWQRKFKKRT